MYKDRDQFASLVREVAAPDVGRWNFWHIFLNSNGLRSELKSQDGYWDSLLHDQRCVWQCDIPTGKMHDKFLISKIISTFFIVVKRGELEMKKQTFYNWHILISLSPSQSLGKAQTAAVKRDAEIGVAQVFLQNQPYYYKLALSSVYSQFPSLFIDESLGLFQYCWQNIPDPPWFKTSSQI